MIYHELCAERHEQGERLDPESQRKHYGERPRQTSER